MGYYTRRGMILAVSASLVIAVVGGSLWYTNIFMSKERRFWTAIENGLKTTSTTKEIVSVSPAASQTHLSRLRLGAQAVVEGRSTIIQRTTQTTSTVVTSNLVTPSEGFVKYEKIETNEKSADGTDFDFSNVVGRWAAQDASDAESNAQASAFSESFVQLVPIANLNAKDRRDIMNLLKNQNAYEVDFTNTGEDSDNDLTVYDVTLNTRAYVAILREVFARQGLVDLPTLDPNGYDPTSQIPLQIAIDGGNAVRKIGFSDDQYESYSDYGFTNSAVLPTETITYTELQSRLQAAQ